MDATALFETISRLVLCHSPSGSEGEVDRLLIDTLGELGVECRLDPFGNLSATLTGTGPGILAITAHKDEIGASVEGIYDDGRVRLRKLGGSFPWVYGEGVMDLLGDKEVLVGVLSFGSRHVSHASPQRVHQADKALSWSDVWLETCLSKDELTKAGVRPGTPVVVGRHRKSPIRMGDQIAGYALDNRASLAILLELARRFKECAPVPTVHLVATSQEEIGASGARYFCQQHSIDGLIALEVAPIAQEYSIEYTDDPVLVVQDGAYIYHGGLTGLLRDAGYRRGIKCQFASLQNFCSDASVSMQAGVVPRAACLAFPTKNTHGFEIAKFSAIGQCADVLEEFCRSHADFI